MKWVFIAITLGCFALGLSCKQKPAETAPTPKPQPSQKTLLRYHFVGAAQFGDGPDGSQFKKIWAMPETPPFRDALLARIAEVSGRFLTNRIPSLGTNAPALFRPLLDDLLQAESLTELRETAKGVRKLDLAIQLGDDRAQVWSTNLWQIASSWNGALPVESKGDGFIGWASKKSNGTDALHVLRAGQWMVVSLGQDQAPSNLLQSIAAQGRPIAAAKPYWLDADIDCAQLKGWFPGTAFNALLADLQIKNFPMAHVTVTPRGEYLITQARLEYAQPIPWKPESWRVPTNLIQNVEDALINLTAVRGLTPLLSESKLFEQFGWSQRPSEIYFWGYSFSPLHSYVALSARDATNLFTPIAKRLEAFVRTNVVASVMGEVLWNSNRLAMTWGRMPVVQPTFSLVNVPEGDFLLLNLFPLVTNAPLPVELLANLARTNLAYYHWEITEWRLSQARAITSLVDLIRKDCTVPQTTPSQRWLTAITTNLGNTVTEITVPSAKQAELVRSSHVGLSGHELVALMRWIEGTNCVEGGGAPLPSREQRGTRAPAKP